MTDDLKYPTGRLEFVRVLTPEQREEAIKAFAELPSALENAVSGLSDEQLDTPYRPGGWTVRQLVHHVADSHANAHGRFRRTLTEDRPGLVGYDQDAWVGLGDVVGAPVSPSIELLRGIHERLVNLLRSLGPDDFAREFDHSDGYDGTLDSLVRLYSWHGAHHVAHITAIRDREGW